MLATWLRPGELSGRHARPASPEAPPGVPTPAPATIRAPISIHAEEALRAFFSFALDGERSKPPTEGELDALRCTIEAGSTALGRLEVQAKYLPRRPSMLPKLLSAMHSDTNSMRELARIISGDPTLLGNLLRVANSAFYGARAKRIENLDRAVTLVGLNGIRSVIATALMHPVMANGSGCFAKFPDNVWEHTQIAADAAELHALQIERRDGFNARLLALVQGLAVNTVFRIVRDEALEICDASAKPAVTHLLEQWVTPIACRIAASWELPEEVQTALTASRVGCALARSLFFGRLAASQLVLVQRNQIREFAARAFVLAGDTRRTQTDRLWNRLVLANQPR